MKTTLLVAGQAGVKMALHPDNPPLASMNSVAKSMHAVLRPANEEVGQWRTP